MKALKTFSAIVSILAALYYGYQIFGNSNGKKYVLDKKHSVYYKGDGLNETNAKDLAENLKEQDYFSGDDEGAVQITKTVATKDTVNLKFVVDQSKITPDIEKAFLEIGAAIPKKVFSGAPIHIYLVDDKIDNPKNLGYVQPVGDEDRSTPSAQSSPQQSLVDPAAQLAPKYKEISGENKLYYSDAALGKLDVITTYLSDAGFFKPGNKLSVVFDKNGKGYFLMVPFAEKYLNDQAFLENVKQMGAEIQTKFFPDDQFTMYACDLAFKPAFSYVASLK